MPSDMKHGTLAGGSGGPVTITGEVEVKNDSGNPIPVSGTFYQATQPVSGTFWQATQPVSLAAAVDVSDRVGRLLGHTTIDNASLAVTGTFWQATQPVSGTFWQATQPVSIAAAIHAIIDSSATIPVSGTFWQATQPVSGTFWQATQPVSLAAAVDVSDRVGRLLGHVTVDNASIPVTGTFWQATQPVSGTFWQATQPVSGTVAVSNFTDNGLTDAQLRATPVPVSGSLSVLLAQFDDGTTATLQAQTMDGKRLLYVQDPALRRLAEQQLLEVRILNQNIAELLTMLGGHPIMPVSDVGILL